MVVTTLRQMKQMREMPNTDIDHSFKSELLFLFRSARRLSVFASFKKESSYSHSVAFIN